MNPFFSAVIPTFNRAKELSRSINSVQNQTFQNWELLIVDDGSTDNTSDIITDFIKSDNRISYHHRPKSRPKGGNACRNYGIEQAKGKYIALLDSDDEWLPQKLQSDFAFLQQSDASGIYGGVLLDNGEKTTHSKTREILKEESYVDFLFETDIIASTCTFVIERECALKIKFDEGLQRHQDLDFFIRFGKAYGWAFNNRYNTRVHWENNRKISPHFPSMIRFYERYENEISSDQHKAQYLVRNWILARNNQKQYKRYYSKRLREFGGKASLAYRLFSLAPDLVYPLWKKFILPRSKRSSQKIHEHKSVT